MLIGNNTVDNNIWKCPSLNVLIKAVPGWSYTDLIHVRIGVPDQALGGFL